MAEVVLPFGDVWSVGMFPAGLGMVELDISQYLADTVKTIIDAIPDLVPENHFHFRNSAQVAGDELSQSFAQNRAHWIFEGPVFGPFYQQFFIRIVQAIAAPGHIWSILELESLPSFWANGQIEDLTGVTNPQPPTVSITGGDTLYVTDAFSLGQLTFGSDGDFFSALFESIDSGTAQDLVAAHSVTWKVRHQATADYLNDTYGLGAVVDDSSFSITYPDVPYILLFRIDAQFPFNVSLSESQIGARPTAFWLIGPVVFV